jgi:NAD(P)-dependent dehydrogenase (short-subunit alcohol dehydrogenase family)
MQRIERPMVGSEALKADSSLAGQVAVVTGASRGVGRAIAMELASRGAKLCLVGRDPIALAGTADAVRRLSEASDFHIDLTDEKQYRPLLSSLERNGGKVDILIHSAGVIYQGRMEGASIRDFDEQFAVNVRAPYRLTQQLLPFLLAARGQIVFLNSSAGLTAKRPEIGQYGATKHALKGIADSLREEVNPKGIRVLTVYMGRTATPMQEALYREEGKAYKPEILMQPEDVASTVVHTLMLPRTAEITDISMRPMAKS